MNGQSGQVMGITQGALSSSATWAPADAARPRLQSETQPEDWSGLERIEQVVLRQRHYMVRDVIAAVAFAGLCVAVVAALL